MRTVGSSNIRFGTKEALKFGDPPKQSMFDIIKTPGQLWQRLDNFGIQSSLYVYDDISAQIVQWDLFAQEFGYKDAKDPEFVDELLKIAKTEPFTGIEILYIHTMNKKLFDKSDFNIHTTFDADMAVVSYSYGGNRIALWKKYSNIEKMSVELVVSGLNTYLDDVVQQTEILTKDTLQLTFAKEGKDASGRAHVFQLLSKMEADYDFDVDEHQESKIWTIHVKKGTSDTTMDFGGGLKKESDIYEILHALYDHGCGSTHGRGMHKKSWADQTSGWKSLAEDFGYGDYKNPTLADDLLKVFKGAFPGIEFLYHLTGNKKLWEKSDFNLENPAIDEVYAYEAAITSYSYGGTRLAVWKKYSRIERMPDAAVLLGLETHAEQFIVKKVKRSGDSVVFTGANASTYEELVNILQSMGEDYGLVLTGDRSGASLTVTLRGEKGFEDQTV